MTADALRQFQDATQRLGVSTDDPQTFKDRVFAGLEKLLRAALQQERLIDMPCLKGNDLTLMALPARVQLTAKVGERFPVESGGYIERTDTEGWVQWKFIPKED